MSILSFFSDDVRQLFESDESSFVGLQPQKNTDTEEIVDTNEIYSLVSA